MSGEPYPIAEDGTLAFLKGETYNRLVADVARAVSMSPAGEFSYYDGASGKYSYDPRPRHKVYQLQASLIRTGSASAKEMVWDGSDWVVRTLPTRTVYGDFTRGYHFANDEVLCISVGARLYALTPGHFFVRGVIDGQLTSGGTATLSVYEENSSDDWQDSTVNVTVSEDIGLDNPVESANVVYANWHEQAQKWIATAAPCSAVDGSS